MHDENEHKTKGQLVSDGIRLVQDKNPRGAIVLFKNALEKDQNYFEARFQLTKAYTAIGNFRHRSFLYDYKFILKHASLVVDTRNAMNGLANNKSVVKA